MANTKNTGPFKTQEEAELARKLGFKPPVRPASASMKKTHGNVVGYFNPNPWPVHIMISSLGGISVTLQQKGDYVLNSDGKKINDPVLEEHVSANGLAREVSQMAVPILYIPRPITVPAPSYAPVQEAEGFSRGPGGVVPVMKPAATIISDVNMPPAGANPVLGMTVEMARKLKLVKPTRTPAESTVVDTDGTPAPADRLPPIEYAEDMMPGEARRMEAMKMAAPSIPSNVTPTAPALHPDMTIAETPEQQATLADLQAAESIDMLGVTDVAKLAPKIPENSPPPVEIQEEAPPAPPLVGGRPVKPEKEKKFICNVDQKAFAFRSDLERHARQKYPDKYDEIMHPYPKVPQSSPS